MAKNYCLTIHYSLLLFAAQNLGSLLFYRTSDQARFCTVFIGQIRPEHTLVLRIDDMCFANIKTVQKQLIKDQTA